jgi:hypothetical protein
MFCVTQKHSSYNKENVTHYHFQSSIKFDNIIKREKT